MKKFNYFLVVLFGLISVVFSSCDPKEWEMTDPSGSLTYGAKAEGKVNVDTIRVGDSIVYVPDSSLSDTIVVTKHDTLTIVTHDTVYVGDSSKIVNLEYVLGSNKEDNITNYSDLQPTLLKANGQIVLNTDVNRSAEISNDIDTIFASKVEKLTSNVSRPTTNSSYDVRGEYDINTGYRDYTVLLSDGSKYKVNTEAESASGMLDGSKKDLLYRMVQGVRVVSIDDELTNDTLIRNKKIYRKVNRTLKAEVESLNRPLMGPEIVTLDTLTIASAAATQYNKIAVVYVEDGDVPEDTVPVIPTDTVIPGPVDTIPTTPNDTGYTINSEKIESIVATYVPYPDETLKRVLLVRTKNYVLPVVNKKKQSPIRVANPNDYNSALYVNNAWVPANLDLSDGYLWTAGAVTANPTEATLNWFASSTGLSLSKSDFLKDATFVHKGKTTLVYLDNNYYMTLQ
jgi:hypothetical protein